MTLVLNTPRGAARMPRAMLHTAQVLTGVWAAGWTIFTVSTFSPRGPADWVSAAGFVAVLWMLVVLASAKPAWGGVLLVAAAALVASSFHNACSWWGMATPAAALGIVLLLLARAGETAPARPPASVGESSR